MESWTIRGARIIDGTGGASRIANVRVEKGRIGRISEEELPGPFVEGEGLWLLPGLIDMHRHGDLTPLRPHHEEEARQGITTYINGNCGFSPAPSSKEHFAALWEYARPIMGELPDALEGWSFPKLLDRMGKESLSANAGYLAGCGALRIAIKGFSPAPMTAEEMDRLCALAGEALDAGAFGLSMGLMYVPENFFAFEELARLCGEAAKRNRFVSLHMRGEGRELLASVEEVCRLARKSGAALHISHLKAAGRSNWGLMQAALDRIDEARREGLDISFDLYPYTAGSTALYTLFPPRLMAGGVEGLLEKLRDSRARKEIVIELREEAEDWDNLVASTGWDSVVLAAGADAGCSVAEIARRRGCSGEEAAMDILRENSGDVPMVFHSMAAEDMELALRREDAIIISDALYSPGGIPHPRKYGALARFLCRYGPKLGWEEAVRRVTSLPARRLRLKKRGMLKEGYAADLLLIDPAEFKDTATYADPVRFPRGIRLVAVNGEIAGEENSGRVLLYEK